MSSTFRSESGNLTYIITTSRMISGDELKLRNGRLVFGGVASVETSSRIGAGLAVHFI